MGLDRNEWNHIRDIGGDEIIDCSGFENMECHNPGEITYTITRSELYYGEKKVYKAPFDKCDRVEDYKVAWAHFEKVFAEEDTST